MTAESIRIEIDQLVGISLVDNHTEENHSLDIIPGEEIMNENRRN